MKGRNRKSILKGSLESLSALHQVASQYSFHNSCEQALAVLFCDLRSVRWNFIKADLNKDIHYGSA